MTQNEHESIKLLIAEYVMGHLDEADRARVHAHLETCRECQESSEQVQIIASDLHALKAEESGKHIPSDLLVRYSENDASIEHDAVDALEIHLLFCASCAGEFAMLRQVNAELGAAAGEVGPLPAITSVQTGSGLARFFLRPVVAYAIAATLTVALGIPAGLHLSGRRSAGSASSGLQVEQVFALTEQMRGSRDVTEVGRSSDTETIHLLLRMNREPGLKYDATLLDSASAPLLHQSLPTLTTESGPLQLSLGTAHLKDGRYALEVRGLPPTSHPDTLIVIFPFALTSK